MAGSIGIFPRDICLLWTCISCHLCIAGICEEQLTDISPDHASSTFPGSIPPEQKDSWANTCNIRKINLPVDGHLPEADVPYIVSLPWERNSVLAGRLERDVLLNTMGNVTCTPSRAGSTRQGITEMKLHEYIHNWMSQELKRNAEENRYLFGEFGDQWAPLRDAYQRPPCHNCAGSAAAITIGLGGLHSGAPWHFHDATFVEVLHGAKHFALLPPGDPAIPEIDIAIKHISQLHWHREKRPAMELNGSLSRLQECVISRGEILYFPNKWHHGAVNLDTYTAFVSTFIDSSHINTSPAKRMQPGAFSFRS